MPADMSPVASATLPFAFLMLVGAMPTAVKAYSWVGCTPVMATLRTAVFLLVRVLHLLAFCCPFPEPLLLLGGGAFVSRGGVNTDVDAGFFALHRDVDAL